jgi:hypothetical protein
MSTASGSTTLTIAKYSPGPAWLQSMPFAFVTHGSSEFMSSHFMPLVKVLHARQYTAGIMLWPSAAAEDGS